MQVANSATTTATEASARFQRRRNTMPQISSAIIAQPIATARITLAPISTPNTTNTSEHSQVSRYPIAPPATVAINVMMTRLRSPSLIRNIRTAIIPAMVSIQNVHGNAPLTSEHSITGFSQG